MLDAWWLLPGNTADITTLLPVVDRLRKRFDIRDVCVVADRGMISAKTIRRTEPARRQYILGARLRNVKETRKTVLSRGWKVEWQRLREDLDELQELTLPFGEKTFAIRTPTIGEAALALQAVGVALGSSVRLLS